MANFYFKLRKEQPDKRGECAIRLFVSIEGKSTPTSTGYKVEPKYWDEAKERIKASHPNAFAWNTDLEEQLKKAKDNYTLLKKDNNITSSKAVSKSLKHGDCFKDIALLYAAQFQENNIGYYKRCLSAINVIDKLFPALKIGQMNKDWADKFRSKYKMKHNTIVSKLSFVSTALNYAVDNRLFPYNPMSGVNKGAYRPSTKPRLTRKEIELIWNYIPAGRWNVIAKLTCLFSYYARGARLTDVLLMRKSSIYYEDGLPRLRWTMNKTKNKTGKVNDMPVNERLMSIIEQANNDSPTIFGIIDINAIEAEKHRKLNIAGTEIGRELSKILLRCGIAKDVSFKDIRRSFLKHVQDISKDIYGTKGVAGHSKVTTTEGYVGEDQQAIDELLGRVYGA